jgi:hypothetical protein
VHAEFWWRSLRKRDHLEDPGEYGRITLRRIFQEVGWWGGGGDGLDLSGSG